MNVTWVCSNRKKVGAENPRRSYRDGTIVLRQFWRRTNILALSNFLWWITSFPEIFGMFLFRMSEELSSRFNPELLKISRENAHNISTRWVFCRREFCKTWIFVRRSPLLYAESKEVLFASTRVVPLKFQFQKRLTLLANEPWKARSLMDSKDHPKAALHGPIDGAVTGRWIWIDDSIRRIEKRWALLLKKLSPRYRHT